VDGAVIKTRHPIMDGFVGNIFNHTGQGYNYKDHLDLHRQHQQVVREWQQQLREQELRDLQEAKEEQERRLAQELLEEEQELQEAQIDQPAEPQDGQAERVEQVEQEDVPMEQVQDIIVEEQNAESARADVLLLQPLGLLEKEPLHIQEFDLDFAGSAVPTTADDEERLSLIKSHRNHLWQC
jgi:flagellar biosynthesis GTPase FlhF